MEVVEAAARAIADLVDVQELADDYIVPSVFDHRVVGTVAGAVQEAPCAPARPPR